MLKLYALFGGRVRPGMDSEMGAYVNDVLAPLCWQLDGAQTERVVFSEE